MLGQHCRTLAQEMHRDAKLLDLGCRNALGVTLAMFRTAKFLFNIAAISFGVYLIEYQSVEAMIATAVVIALVLGPEGVETWLIRQGVLAERDRQQAVDANDDE